jgi:hypothetical protein
VKYASTAWSTPHSPLVIFGECRIPLEVFKDLLMHAPIFSQVDRRIVGEVRTPRNRAVITTTYDCKGWVSVLFHNAGKGGWPTKGNATGTAADGVVHGARFLAIVLGTGKGGVVGMLLGFVSWIVSNTFMFKAFWSDWLLAVNADDLVGIPSSDVAPMYWVSRFSSPPANAVVDTGLLCS